MSTLRQYRIALQIFQSNRLRRDYHDLAEIAEYEQVGEFFFNEMYGPRDFSARDTEGRRLQNFLAILPGVHLHDLDGVLDLLDLTNQLDDDLARRMLAAGTGVAFDEATYEQFYRLADNYDARHRQLDLVQRSLHNVFQLSRSALLGIALRRSGLVARLAGIGHVYEFLRSGYDALCNVGTIDLFAETIHARELARLDRIYER